MDADPRRAPSRVSPINVVLFLVALLLSSTAPIGPSAARAGVEPVPFHGWLVAPLGSAILGDELPPPFLDVNGIGSSGQDGVRFEVGSTRGHIGPVRWMAPESIPGRQYEIRVTGSDAAGDLTWSLLAQELGVGVVQFAIDPGNLVVADSDLLLTLSDNGNPVYEADRNNSLSPLFEGSAPPTGVIAGLGENFESLLPGPAKMKVKESIRDLIISFEGGTQITVPGVGTFTASEARISHHLRHRDRLVLHHVDVLFTEPLGMTGSQRLSDVAMGPYNADTRALGGALLQSTIGGSYEHLTLSNIGSSGDDGVAIDLEHGDVGESLLWDTAGAPAPSRGQSISIDAEGHRGGFAGQPIAGTTCRAGDSFFDVFVDAANTAPPTSVEFYLDGLFVAAATDPSATLMVQTTNWPDGGGIEAEDAWEQPTAIWTWDQPVSMVSGTGPPVTADELRIVIPSLHTDVDWIDRIIFRPPPGPAGAPGDWTLLGRRNVIHPPDPIYPWTALRGLHAAGIVHRDIAARVSNIGSSGEDGVVVEFEPSTALGIQWHSAQTGAGSPGERIMTPVYGTTDGSPDRPIVIGRLWNESTGSEIQVGGDLSPLGVGGLTFNYYDDGVLVGSVMAVNDAPALSMPAPPIGLVATLGPGTGSSAPVFYLQLVADTPVTELGGPTKRMNKADLIEVLASGSPRSIPAELFALSVRVTSIPWVVVDKPAGHWPVDAPPARETPGLTLHPNVPNPFNPRTSISFELDRPGPTSLRIYDPRGRLVEVLQDGYLEAGSYDRTWDGMDARGRSVASGVYLIELEAVGTRASRKMSLVR